MDRNCDYRTLVHRDDSDCGASDSRESGDFSVLHDRMHRIPRLSLDCTLGLRRDYGKEKCRIVPQRRNGRNDGKGGAY